jgi:hypothetical protein
MGPEHVSIRGLSDGAEFRETWKGSLCTFAFSRDRGDSSNLNL